MKHSILAIMALLLTQFLNPFQTQAQTFKVTQSQPRDDGDFIVLLKLKISGMKFGQKIEVQTLCPNTGKVVEALDGKNLVITESKENFFTLVPQKLGKDGEFGVILYANGDDWNRADTVNWFVQVQAGDLIQTYTGQYLWLEEETSLTISQPKYPTGWGWEKSLYFKGGYTGDPYVGMKLEFANEADMKALLQIYGQIRGLLDEDWRDHEWELGQFGYGTWDGFRYGLPNLDKGAVKKYKADFKRAQSAKLTTPVQEQEFVLLEGRIEAFNALEEKVLSGGGWLIIDRMDGSGKIYSYEYEFGALEKTKKANSIQ